ncbi:glycosyl hydrolase family 28 protein [Microbacter margulisiae]|uniref:Polygalacturonase n=1 Tax=Microbacter margulisiae TaxID=1350067 RepID=A0A7W5DRX8_9PORP|nr:glycosyl hydrolase family 28 protein [Microbacter margulisiae]MBB3187960.1 polygalacturonase [Microbacter margulisiae]
MTSSKNKLLLLCGCLLFEMFSYRLKASDIPLPTIPRTQFLITNYGASITNANNAAYINAAINAANAAGGGTVVFPKGTFLSGPITMKSNVNLYLADQDTLEILPYGSGNGLLPNTYPNNGSIDQYNPFIFGQNLNNIEVSGSGVIEGNGSAWWTAYASNSSMKRPCLIRFKACNTVLITGITLENSPGVHVTLGQSSSMGSNGTISYITVKAPSTSPNTDAIDTWYWNGIYIHHCNLSEGDDNVAMDSYSQNVTIKDCTLGYGHGISVGSYATAVHNITVDSCIFTNTTNGLRLKSQRDRGGSGANAVYNLSYSNITMTNVKWPFYITSYYYTSSPSISDPAQAITSTTPTWRDIYFKNITVNNSTYAGFIWGLPEQYVENVVFDNVKINATSRGMQTCFVDTLIFKNCSSITIPSGKGNAIYNPYDTINFSGLNPITGASTSCSSTGINEVIANGLHCYPNPVKGNVINLSADNTIVQVQLYSLLGLKLKEEHVNAMQFSMDISSLSSGYYILNVFFENGTVASQKLIKE